MKRNDTRRYCLDRSAIAALQRDGFGWGHDLDAGCVTLQDRRESRLSPRKFYRKLRRGV